MNKVRYDAGWPAEVRFPGSYSRRHKYGHVTHAFANKRGYELRLPIYITDYFRRAACIAFVEDHAQGLFELRLGSRMRVVVVVASLCR